MVAFHSNALRSILFNASLLAPGMTVADRDSSCGRSPADRALTGQAGRLIPRSRYRPPAQSPAFSGVPVALPSRRRVFSKNVRSAPRSARASVCRSRFCSYVETRPYPIVDIGFLRIQTLCCFTETYLPAAGDYRYQGIAPLKNVGLWTLDKT